MGPGKAVDMITRVSPAGVRCHSRWWTTSSWDIGERADPVALSGRAGRTGTRHRHLGRAGVASVDRAGGPRGGSGNWLDRAQAYAARVGAHAVA